MPSFEVDSTPIMDVVNGVSDEPTAQKCLLVI